MRTYADTSFLFSLYAPDANSGRADIWRMANPQPLPLTQFHRLELRNAFSLAIFQERLTAAEVQSVWGNLEADIASGLLAPCEWPWQHVLAEAERIAASHTPSFGTRTLDVIHIAGAKVLGHTEFCTFDSKQSVLARELGFTAVVVP